MAISYELVNGAAFASQASRILEEAWTPPALSYSPEYLQWQLGFPAPLPAAAAFEDGQPVGFAAATSRRLRHASTRIDAAVVSFVAVRPAWRNRGAAAGIYRRLLAALKESRVPVLTYAIAGSGGERTLLRAYADAGFEVRPLGVYPIYAFQARGKAPVETASLPAIVEACAADRTLLWSDPSEAQLAHYLQDPRPRQLVAFPQGAAWSVRAAFRTARGLDTVTTMESLFLPRQAASLPLATSAFDPGIVTAPNLFGFDPADLRRCGIRRTGATFHGYFCTADGFPLDPEVQGTNLEVI